MWFKNKICMMIDEFSDIYDIFFLFIFFYNFIIMFYFLNKYYVGVILYCKFNFCYYC